MLDNIKKNTKFHLNCYKRQILSLGLDIETYFNFVVKKEKIIEQYKKLEDNSFIDSLFFQVTNICNSNCVFCIYSKVKHKQGVMKFSTFKKAVDDYVSLGGKTISFSPIVGELLIDTKIMDKINYAVKLKKLKRIYFYTNGILLNKNKIYKKLIDSGIHEISISMADPDKKNYERVYRVPFYEDVITGVHNLLKYNKEKGEKVKIIIIFKSAAGLNHILQSKDFKRYIKPYLSNKVQYDVCQYYDNWGGAIKQNDLVGIMKMSRPAKFKKIPCIRTFHVSILFDGSVRLCGCRFKTTEFDDMVIGNINKNNLRDIINGEKAKTIRKNFLHNKLPEACKACSAYIPINMRWIKNILKNTN